MRSLAMLISVAFMQLLYHSSFGQCKTAPPLEACLGTESTLTDNSIVLNGTKKWYYGAPVTYNQITMRGGTLVVCTDLTINVLIMDSGTIVIRPGARLTAGGGGSGMIWRGGCAVYNHGTFDITSNLSFEGPDATAARPNILMNVTATAYMRAFNYLVINNPFSFFVNNGRADFHGIITDNNSVAGSVCLGTGSQLKQTVLINKVKNTYTAPWGNACVSVYQFSQFSDTLTSTPKVLICLSSGHTSATGGTNRPNAWGTANVFQNCNNCSEVALLPVHNISSRSYSGQDEQAAAVTVFPNPFLQVVQISWVKGKKPRSVMIVEHTGRVVYYKNLEGEMITSLPVSLPSLPAGNYIARIIYPETVIVCKIIKAR